MKRFNQLVFLCLAALCFGSLATAQATKGTIAGRVFDSSGAVLQGAQVQIQPKGLTLASDGQGEFAVTDLAPGNYKVLVSYLGFDAFETEVAVVSGEIKRVDAKMEVNSKSESVIVTAERPRGEAESINRTRMADNILQVLPAEVITSLPNANVADALGRLPSVTLERIEGEGVYIQVRGTEPRLTNVTINGITVPVAGTRPCARSGWIRFRQIWWSRSKSIKPWRRISTAMASAAPST